MPKKNSKSGIVRFTIAVIAAGACNAFARVFTIMNSRYADGGGTALPFFSTLLFVLNIAIYMFLILYWILSVRERILPSRARSYIIWAGISMVYFVIYHAVKYRVFEVAQLPVMRFMWYSFYIPLILIPTFLLMTSIRIRKGDDNSGFNERLLLIPAFALCALVMTNSLHQWLFTATYDYELSGIPNTYKNGFLFYTVYGYLFVATIIALIILTKANGGRKKPLKTATPFLLLLLIPIMYAVNRILTNYNAPQPFLISDMAMVFAIAVFESCIRGRLIQYNEDYAGLFGKMTLPALITGKRLNPVYKTAKPVAASREELEKSLEAPVYTDADTKLLSKGIRTGYVFWSEDESELHKAEFKLSEANEIIASENSLISAENRLREEKARVDFHNRSFEKIAEHIAPAQNRAVELSQMLDADSADFEKTAARILVIDCYIKRCINMILLSDGKENIRSGELIRSFTESADYLSYCGVKAVVNNKAGEQIKSGAAIAFYDLFELIAEKAAGKACEFEIYLYDDRLKILSDIEISPDASDLPLKIITERRTDKTAVIAFSEEVTEL